MNLVFFLILGISSFVLVSTYIRKNIAGTTLRSPSMAEREAEATRSFLQAMAQEERNYEHTKTNTWFAARK